MGFSGFILLASILIMVVVHIVQMFLNNRETNIAYDIISAGLTLILSSVPALNDSIASLVAGFLNINLPDTGNIYVLLVVGILLILTGIIYKQSITEKIFVLNILGIHKKEISENTSLKDLKIADYKLKEQVIDFMTVFNGGNGVDERANEYIIKQIQEDCIKFVNRTKDYVSCFTGMAPIPYTIFAGTYLGNAKINRYFEYNRLNGEKYYELKNATFLQKRKNWSKLMEVYPAKIDTEASEIVLAIAISHTVEDNDLKQFKRLDIVHLKLNEPKDNIIKYYEQLLEYKNVINCCLDANLRKYYPNLKRVHIVASIPSCVSIEIGKSIGMGTNRVSDITVYHFMQSNTPKYPYGVRVSGQDKGRLITER